MKNRNVFALRFFHALNLRSNVVKARIEMLVLAFADGYGYRRLIGTLTMPLSATAFFSTSNPGRVSGT